MSQVVDHLMACRTPADFYRLQILLECDATPRQLARLFPFEDRLPQEAREWVRQTRAVMFLQATRVQPFWKRLLAQNAALYSTRQHPGEPRDLLIAFCGLADRLQVPIAVALQHLDGARFDVLVLRDPSKRIYLDGISGYGADLIQVAERIRRDLDLGSYRSIRSFGTSGGAWAALTVGTMLGAERAIAMSGSPPGFSFRLTSMWERRGYSTDEKDVDFSVFERQFMSITERSTQLLAIYAEDCEKDRVGAQGFETLVDAAPIAFAGMDNHNLMFEIAKRRHLASFFDHYLCGDLDEIIPPRGQRSVAMESLAALAPAGFRQALSVS